MTISISGRIVGRGVVGLAALLMSSAAFAAPDAKTVADSIVAAVQARDGATASYGAANQSGDVVTISDFKVSSPKHGEVTVPAIVVTGAADRQPGGFTATSIAFDNGKVTERDNTVTWATGMSRNAVVPTPAEITASAKIVPFSEFTISDITASDRKDQPNPAKVASVSVKLGDAVDGVPSSMNAAISGVMVPLSTGPGSPAKDMATPLLGDTLNLDIVVDGTFDAAKQTTTFQQISVDSPGLGKLSISGTFGGVPLDKMASPDAGSAAADTATIENATIRFENYGIVQKALETQAKALGASPSDLATMLPASLPILFSQARITDVNFQNQLLDALPVFLKDPKSLTVTLNPSAPVALAGLAQQARTSIDAVIGKLGIGIKANN